MADDTAVKDDATLLAELKAEIARLVQDCRATHAHRAAYFLSSNHDAILRIALAARKEPKKAALPSPFVYSMQ